MTYAGLTISDKPALMDAKALGAKWVARDKDTSLFGYVNKPKKLTRSRIWKYCGEHDWVRLIDSTLPFIQWSDAEPVNIDLAIAQIAEMESAAEAGK